MDKDDILISICIPVYNSVKYIEHCINSWLNQTYKNIEIIVQDDCSNDGTWELLVNTYSRKNEVKLYRNTINLGIGNNWNEAYSKCKGNYIVIFNADDWVESTFLEKCFDKLNEGYKIVTTSFSFYFEESDEVVPYPPQCGIAEGEVNELFNLQFRNTPFHWDFTLVNRTILESAKINHDLFLPTQVCDFELWLRIAQQDYKVFYIKENLGYYRRHSDNNSSKMFSETSSLFIDVYPKYHKLLMQRCPAIYKKKIFASLILNLKTIIRHFKLPKIKVILNIIKYNILSRL